MSDQEVQHVFFDYIKSESWRSIHVDGAIGGPTPAGFIHIAFYCERPAIPQRVAHGINSDGTLGAEIPTYTESRGSIVRELDCDAFMSVQTARALRDWLSSTIETIDPKLSETGK